MRGTCYYIILGLLLASTGYTIYLSLSNSFSFIESFRNGLFIFQQIYLIGFIVWRHFYITEENTDWSIKSILIYCSSNFVLFGGFQLYGLISNQTNQSPFSQGSLNSTNFGYTTFIHLYYQFNIYNGIFFIFTAFMGVMYFVQQRERQRDLQQVLEDIKQLEYQATGNQDSCSICLGDFEVGEKCIKLICAHIFHKQCLEKWLHENVTCPMCRDNIKDRFQEQQENNRID